MENFNKFTLEVKRLEVKVIEGYLINGHYSREITPEENPNLPYPKVNFLWLGHYHQNRSNYNNELAELQQIALNDILALGQESAKLFVKQLDGVNARFKSFWKEYLRFCADFREKKHSNISLEKIYDFFNVSREDKNKIGTISYVFIHDLHDAAAFKQAYVLTLKSDLEKILGIDIPENNNKTANQITAPIAPNYLLPLATLQRVHSYFDDDLWEPIDVNNFYNLFDINNRSELPFQIKKQKKDDFYALLWSMYQLSNKTVSQEKFIEPLLSRYNGSFKSFGNVRQTRIECPKPKCKKLMKKINEALR